MGILISRFKKKKTTIEILEKLEKDITNIEKYRNSTEQRRRRIVGQMVVYSVGAYVLAAALFYFYWFPSTLKEQLYCVTPLALFPLLVMFVRKILTFYYSRKITKNELKLSDLRAEKKRILEDVMNKETYKVACDILEKFAPEQLKSKAMEPNITPQKGNFGKTPAPTGMRDAPLFSSTPSHPILRPPLPLTELRRRTLPAAPGNTGPNIGPVISDSFSASVLRAQIPGASPSLRPSINGLPGPSLPRPVIPRERSYFETFFDWFVGDGPSNRFALICSSCKSHNGMALKEEFEYLSFRCCFCDYFNPARKQRPQAPRLSPTLDLKLQSQGQNTSGSLRDSETSDSEKNSGSDSSDEDTEPDLEAFERTNAKKETSQEGESEGSKEKGETSLDREAEEFLKSLPDGKEEETDQVKKYSKQEDAGDSS